MRHRERACSTRLVVDQRSCAEEHLARDADIVGHPTSIAAANPKAATSGSEATRRRDLPIGSARRSEVIN